MLSRVKLDSFRIESSKRILKFLRLGKNDVQTAGESAPWGIDSAPVKDCIAIYGPTLVNGKAVILGYINKQQLADVGELHLYSTDSEGNEKFRIKIKNDGNCEIGGNSDNAVRYTPLNQGLQDFKDLLIAELIKIQTGIIAAGGSYTPGVLTVTISDAKINNIKTP